MPPKGSKVSKLKNEDYGRYKMELLLSRFSRAQLFVTPWTVPCQVPLSLGFSRQEYWSGLLFPSPGHLPDSGIEPGSPALQADSLPSELPGEKLTGAQ